MMCRQALHLALGFAICGVVLVAIPPLALCGYLVMRLETMTDD